MREEAKRENRKRVKTWGSGFLARVVRCSIGANLALDWREYK